MSTALSAVYNESEFTPEEAALMMRLRVFVNMRWVAILGIIIASLVASLVFDIGFPTLPVYIICALIALYNLVLFQQLKGLHVEKKGEVVPKLRIYSNIHIFLDLAALTFILHYTGGIENPFLFYFIFHIILASIALPYITVYLLATAAVLMVGLLVWLEYAGVLFHYNLQGFADPTLYQEGSYVLAVFASLATILYASAYMASAISGELRKRQREVVQLGEKRIDEKNEELDRVSQEMTRLEEERSRFLNFISIAAHDLKAPLSAIQSYIGVMLGGYSGDITDKQKNMLERSQYRITELLRLISDLLDIPRIETGQIVQEMKEISYCQVVRDCLNDQTRLAEEKGLKLIVELPETTLTITGSGTRLQQVITNLVNNAIIYTEKGTITLRVKETAEEIQTEIMDTGIGIPGEDIPRVFEDFFRGSNVSEKGTGLGLSIVKRIIEAHGGRIWIESPCTETNCGSRFTFLIPKAEAMKRG